MTMIETSRLHDELMQVFHDELFLEVESVETDLLEQELLDSLSFVQLLVRLESRYCVEVPLDELDMERFRTIEKISAYIQEMSA